MNHCKNFRITLAELRELKVEYFVHNNIVRALAGKELSEDDEDADYYFRSSHREPLDLEFILQSCGFTVVASMAECFPEECYQDLRLFSLWYIRQYAHLIPDWRVQQSLEIIEECVRKNNIQRKFADAMELLISTTDALSVDSCKARGKYQRTANSIASASRGIRKICEDLLEDLEAVLFSVGWVTISDFVDATGGSTKCEEARYQASCAISAKLKEMFMLMLHDKAPWQI